MNHPQIGRRPWLPSLGRVLPARVDIGSVCLLADTVTKYTGKRQGRPCLSVRMDRRDLRRLYRVAKRLDRVDASALIRELVEAIVSGDTAERRRVLNDLSAGLDALEAKVARQMPLAGLEPLGVPEGASTR
jgi:hypothetical protein